MEVKANKIYRYSRPPLSILWIYLLPGYSLDLAALITRLQAITYTPNAVVFCQDHGVRSVTITPWSGPVRSMPSQLSGKHSLQPCNHHGAENFRNNAQASPVLHQVYHLIVGRERARVD